MKFLIDGIFGFLSSFIRSFAKKYGFKKALLMLTLPIYVSFVGLLISFFTYFILYIMKIWNLIKEILPKMYDYSSAATGSFAGLSNSTIISSTMEFLHACGLADAFSISMDLFISLLSMFLILQLYKVVVFVRKEITDLITSFRTFI